MPGPAVRELAPAVAGVGSVQGLVGDGDAVQSLLGGDDGEVELLDHFLEVVFLCRGSGRPMDGRNSLEGLAHDLGFRVHVCRGKVNWQWMV